MNTPDPIEPQQPPRSSLAVLTNELVEPTVYEPDPDTNVVISNPYKVRLGGVWWLLDSGYAIRADLFEFDGRYLDETTSAATNRYYLYRYLSWAEEAIRVAELVRVDHLRRTAVCEDGRGYPSDITLECLLSLAGEGSVAYAIPDEDGHAHYRVHQPTGAIAAMSPWTPKYQAWFDHEE